MTGHVILGIDPGTVVMGYGLVKVGGSGPVLVEMGILKLAQKDDHAERLGMIFNKVTSLIKVHKPEAVAIEAPFFGKNVQSMLKLGRAQGVAIAAAMAEGLTACEYAPKRIKQSITGRGNATKEQVWAFLQHTLNITESPEYFDATDAVAAAMCHYYTGIQLVPTAGTKPVKREKKQGWEQFVTNNPGRIIK